MKLTALDGKGEVVCEVEADDLGAATNMMHAYFIAHHDKAQLVETFVIGSLDREGDEGE
jgi:hypothetical protein